MPMMNKKTPPGSRKGMLRRFGVVIASLAMAVGASLVWAPAASAVTSRCDLYDMCWHYNSAANGFNATYGQATNLLSVNPNVNGGVRYYFTADQWGSAGAGQNVWNNAGGARNRDTYWIMRSHYNSGCTGPADLVYPGTAVTLSTTYNENASMCWI
jgi:hypothetical protein